MEKILGHTRNTEDDYYHILGCDESASCDQILAEFRVRALDVHPDRHPDNEQSEELFKKLLNAKQVLTDSELRKNYDSWRSSGIAMPYEQWQAVGKNAQMCFHWAVRKQNDLMLEPQSEAEGLPTSDPLQRFNLDQTGNKDSKPTGTEPRIRTDDVGLNDFRCDGESPSEALRKFRSYEI